MIQIWNKKIKFEDALNDLKDIFFNSLKFYFRKDRKKQIGKSLIYSSIAIIQLTNGLIASEAVESFKNWLLMDNPICVLRRKRIERKVIIPPILEKYKKLLKKIYLEEFNKNELDVNKYRVWCQYNLKINTHSLKYAFEEFITKKIGEDFNLRIRKDHSLIQKVVENEIRKKLDIQPNKHI
ncbi:hypothetical protein [Methanocaldococcus sp.]